jgi:4a-hydroxytetrahydrobiopterin dehydratase
VSEQNLADRHCVPCKGGTPALDRERVNALIGQLDGWAVQETSGHLELFKELKFRNFVEAVDFVNKLTPVAEAEGHHPDLEVSWGRVGVRLWTHVAGGLTENDFVMAAKLDRLLTGRS